MKKLLLTIVCALLLVTIKAQVPATINFETVGTDSAWFIFANVTDNPAYCAVADNPETEGLNTSAKAGMLEVETAANPWAGMYSTTAITPFKWSADNSIIKILVYKDVVSDFDLKFEALTSSEYAKEVKVANTLTNQWEELIFDFSAYIGDTNTIRRIILIPDFPAARTAGSINYIDNIDFGLGTSTAVNNSSSSMLRFYPNPTENELFIDGLANTTVTIYNIMGTQVLTKVINSASDKMDVSNLISGIYLIKAGNQTERLVVR